MKKTFLSFTIFFVSIILISCSKPKPEKVVVGEMSEYHDPAYGFTIKYPKDWKSMGESGKALFSPSEAVHNNFLDPVNGKRIGAEVSVVAKIAEEGKTIETLLNDSKTEIQQSGTISKEEAITIGGKDGKKISYQIPITTKLAIIGYTLYIPDDTLLFEIDFRAFGDYFDAHSDVFSTMEKSFIPPVIQKKTDNRFHPSEQFEKYDTPYFSMEYPSNFNFTSPPKGKNDFVVQLGGERLDCTIRFDVFGANKWTIDKVWEQNEGKYKAKKKGDVMIDGNKAYWVDYPGAANIDSRAYFMVKNDKVIRITWNIYSPEKDLYSTVFEKTVNSLKLK